MHRSGARHREAGPMGAVAVLLVSSLLLCATAQDQASQAPSALTAQELIRHVVENELKSEQQDHSYWMSRLETRRPNGEEEVDEVVESKEGDLKRPLLINGRELSPAQRAKADKQLQELVRNPESLRKARSEAEHDTERGQRLLKMLPDAFTFRYGEKRGDLVELKFSPNPNFRPSSHEGEVFHAMQGTLWVDCKENRLQEISGRLMREVKFTGGLLGHLDQGGTFEVKQAAVAPGYWELILLSVHMKGKALFFKTIAVDQQYTRSEFKQIADNVTVREAAIMLQKGRLSSEGTEHSQ